MELFLELPVITYRYSDRVYRLAKRAEVKPEEIAERDKEEPKPTISMSQWRLDLVLGIIVIDQDQENLEYSIVKFSNGSVDFVAMHHRRLARCIQKFLKRNNVKFAFYDSAITEQQDPEDDLEDK